MIQAAAYIRVSTGDQTEYSPDAQLRAIRAWAAARDMEILPENVFSDEGISGRRADRRPAFQAMIGRAREKPRPFSVILVHRFDRFARSREDSVIYKSMLKKKYGVRVLSVTESIEEEKFSLILEAMLEAMAEYYSLNLSEEVKKGMTEKALRGALQTSPPFGYKVHNNLLVPIPDEERFVRLIFEKYTAGASFTQISRELNSMGAKTHRGGSFDSRAVKYILQNPVYIGCLRWTPSGRAGRTVGRDTITVPDCHRPIVSREIWQTAAERLDEYHRRRKKLHPEAPMENWVRPSDI
ncbi:MAG: recombinase family protein [Oscillospiraceae bacterium]|nr:recombinase family protein [Oscillospiraceae bacterium]